MRVTAKQLAWVLYELTESKSKADIQNSVADFARYIYKERKLKFAAGIIEQFTRIHNREKGIVEAEITTRKKLSDSELDRIEKYVAGKYGAKKAVLKNTVDESIKGGFVLRVGDEVTDGSVRGKLEELRKILTR